jgi:chromosome partitioning protein
MIVLVGIEKGGTGKTTIASSLAAMRAMAGKDVLLVDADHQGSAAEWARVRADEAEKRPLAGLTCVSKHGTKAGHDIVQMKSRFDDVIVDAGGRDSVELRSAMVIAERMVMPVRPSQFDTWTLGPMIRLVNEARALGNELTPILVINASSPNPQVKEAEELAKGLAEYEEFYISPAVLCDRIAYRRAVIDGMCVLEMPSPDQKAVAELKALYKVVFDDNFKQAR